MRESRKTQVDTHLLSNTALVVVAFPYIEEEMLKHMKQAISVDDSFYPDARSGHKNIK